MPKRPVAILLNRETYELYSSLRKGDELERAINWGLDVLRNNMFPGERVRKWQIPKYYVDKFGVNNLYRLRLDRARRLGVI